MAATVYGGRWYNLGSLGEGAQGHIFRVSESKDQNGQAFALKRLKKDNRADRFLQEINALKSINHPNVIRIIDYSNAELSDNDGFSYYFVMPIAQNGNLKKRVGLYSGDLDGVISVALGLSAALSAAHGAGYIHRDVKPENILFNSLDHNPWLSDFGICHNVDSERLTKSGDVMGPRGFTAPELESGDCKNIDPSCDIYSLGKVIYYMISGGTVIGRENFDAEFQKLGQKGERYRLLQILLTRMIAVLENRISKIEDVTSELTTIRDWEHSARKLALAPDVLAKIDKRQQDSIDTTRVKAENARIQENIQLVLNTTARSICEWLRAELEKLRPLMLRSGTYSINVQDATWEQNYHFGANDYIAIAGVEILFVDSASIFPVTNVLKFFVCKKTRLQITFGDKVQPIKPVDPKMALIPYFLEYNNQEKQFNSVMRGFIKSKVVVEQSQREFVRRMGQRYAVTSEPLIAKTFVGHPVNLIVEFQASEWPSILDKISSVFSESVGVVIEHSASNTRAIGA